MASIGGDPDAQHVEYIRHINEALQGRPDGMSVTTHMCRGNFRSSWVAEGGYDHVAEALFDELEVDGYFMEWDDERSGGFEPLRFLPAGDKQVVLGLVTTKRGALESKDDLKRRIEEASRYAPLDQLCLSPQCGFSSTVDGNALYLRRAGRKARARRRGRRRGVGAMTLSARAVSPCARVRRMSGMMGQRILRVEDDRFLRGRGLYVENQEVPGALHATFVRSPVAHARIVGIDTSAVSSVPGAQVFTAADVELGAVPAASDPGRSTHGWCGRSWRATSFASSGDIVAVVLTEDTCRRRRRRRARAGRLRARCPPSSTPRQALTGDVLLFPELGTNVCASHPVEAPDEALFDGCDVVVSGRLVSQRLAACPLEARGCVAAIGDDGRMTLWLSTQTPHLDRHVLGLFLGLGRRRGARRRSGRGRAASARRG